jgi:hypothetical protein
VAALGLNQLDVPLLKDLSLEGLAATIAVIHSNAEVIMGFAVLLLAIVALLGLVLLISRIEMAYTSNGQRIWLSPLIIYTPPGCFPICVGEFSMPRHPTLAKRSRPTLTASAV